MVGMAKRCGNLAGQVLRDAFQDHRKRTGLLHRDGVAQHRFAPFFIAALNLIAAELMHRLRRQADMAHDRHAGVDDGANRFLRPRRRLRA